MWPVYLLPAADRGHVRALRQPCLERCTLPGGLRGFLRHGAVKQALKIVAVLALGLSLGVAAARGDGMVVSEPAQPLVEIPDQRALISFANGVERLVIETSFLGEGTNFAWVVPLPAAPKIEAVSPGLFADLELTFQPRFVSLVQPYYLAALLLCGVGLLGWRALQDEVSWIRDLPLCLALAVGAWVWSGHLVPGLLLLGAAVYLRLFTRSPASLALGMVACLGVIAFAGILASSGLRNLVNTLGADESASASGVKVLAAQRVGLFDTTTIEGRDPQALLRWLEAHGCGLPDTARPVIRDYLDRGWVFVASRVHRSESEFGRDALHPLAFTFATATPLYPTRLTALNGRDCAMDLYVFGARRAAAPHFRAVRCARIEAQSSTGYQEDASSLLIDDPEARRLIGDAAMGTKLSARLTPRQMSRDVELRSRWNWTSGATVYSYAAALNLALNASVPLAALGWLALGASRGGWNIDGRTVTRWRWKLVAIALGLGLVLFVVLPKVRTAG